MKLSYKLEFNILQKKGPMDYLINGVRTLGYPL